jgi:hypothetical protein
MKYSTFCYIIMVIDLFKEGIDLIIRYWPFLLAYYLLFTGKVNTTEVINNFLGMQ